MAFQSAVEAATVVINKQKTCASRVDSSVQRLISLVEAAKARVEAADPKESPESVLAELDKQIQEEMKKATTQTKELHSAVGKLGKVCDACVLHTSTRVPGYFEGPEMRTEGSPSPMRPCVPIGLIFLIFVQCRP